MNWQDVQYNAERHADLLREAQQEALARQAVAAQGRAPVRVRARAIVEAIAGAVSRLRSSRRVVSARDHL